MDISRDRRWLALTAAMVLLAGLAAAVLWTRPVPQASRQSRTGTGGSRTLVVTKTTDTADGTCDGDCSLREAIIASNATSARDKIVLKPVTYELTRSAVPSTPERGDLDITASVHVQGNGAVIDQEQGDRVVQVHDGATVLIDRVTVTDGRTNAGGGGIRNDGTLTLKSSRVWDNTAQDSASSLGGLGGGIWNEATLKVISSEISQNEAEAAELAGGRGGGIWNSGDLRIEGSTVSENVAVGPAAEGGGIYNIDTLYALSVTLGMNEATGASSSGGNLFLGDAQVRTDLVGSLVGYGVAATGPDCRGALFTQGTVIKTYSIASCLPGGFTPMTGDDYFFGTLDDEWGGFTATNIYFGPTDIVSPEHCTGVDQRGVPRPQGSGCEPGASESAYCGDTPVSRVGTTEADVIEGTSGDDEIMGLDGNDTIFGNEGEDVLCGAGGNDKLYGGEGGDHLHGQSGADICIGGPDEDAFTGCTTKKQ